MTTRKSIKPEAGTTAKTAKGTRARPVKSSSAIRQPSVARKVTDTKQAAPPPASQPPVGAKSKHKLVRDSFTIPKSEYLVLQELKLRAANLKRPTKKSELLRAGIVVLSELTDKAFLNALSGVPSLKTGRPKTS